MGVIEWNSSFSVGVTLIDEQHKQFIGILNLLESNTQVSVRSELISELLGKLVNYAHDHFQAEEELLEKWDYPDLARQKEEHKLYRKKILSFCQAAIDHQETVPEELHRFLHDWWLNHIMKSDMDYKAFFAEREKK